MKLRNLLSGVAKCALLIAVTGSFSYAATPWTNPTPEELSMTSEPRAPGSSAIYLNFDEFTEDRNQLYTLYVRMKILSEEGRHYGDVEIGFADRGGQGFSVDEVDGRTIHPDGTVIPFAGKPMEKMIAKQGNARYMEKVFSLPDVQVGSIIEYRYKIRWDRNLFRIPAWLVQREQFARSVHFRWRPSNDFVYFEDGSTNGAIRWLPMVPKDAKIKATQEPAGPSDASPQMDFDVVATNLPARPDEDFMPPVRSLSYRVLFFYSFDRDGKEYWGHSAKTWSRNTDQFISVSPKLKEFALSTTAGATTPDEKVKKLYAAVQAFENTDFTRARSKAEEKLNGLKTAESAEDILSRKRGDGDDLALLFIGLVRSLGMKAYAMQVTNRDHNVFQIDLMSRRQLDDMIAIVDVEGKETYFDPGQKGVPAGHLIWKHSSAGGVRQSDKGPLIAQSGAEDYQFSQMSRAADLRLSPDGNVTGAIFLTYTGNPAIEWRQKKIKTDETELKQQIQESVQEMIPDGLRVEVQKIDQTDTYEQPLKINLKVEGHLGTATSKRLILPGDIFEVKSKPLFTKSTREFPIYFPYEMIQRDGVRVVFPAALAVEASPSDITEKYQTDLIYAARSEKTANSITIRREFVRNSILFDWKEYAGVRDFFHKVQARDQESIILQAPATAAAN